MPTAKAKNIRNSTLRCCQMQLNLLYALCSRSALALYDLVFDLVADCERCASLDLGVVYIHVLSVLARDESESTCGIEHLYFSLH